MHLYFCVMFSTSKKKSSSFFVADQHFSGHRLFGIHCKTVFSTHCACLTCCHVDEDALPRPHVGHLKQHHVRGDVVNGQSGSFLKAHLLGHGEGTAGGHNDHFLPQAAAAQHDDSITHLREEGEEEMVMRMMCVS